MKLLGIGRQRSPSAVSNYIHTGQFLSAWPANAPNSLFGR